MGVHCEGVEGATAKPPPRLRRGEISAPKSHCSRKTYISINDKKG